MSLVVQKQIVVRLRSFCRLHCLKQNLGEVDFLLEFLVGHVVGSLSQWSMVVIINELSGESTHFVHFFYGVTIVTTNHASDFRLFLIRTNEFLIAKKRPLTRPRLCNPIVRCETCPNTGMCLRQS